jgi:pimeloyl-ACP methyl ester carboxylesterase
MSEETKVHADVVVLVPGFLGFSVLGQYAYFADRVVATLSSTLHARWGREVSVVSASTVPAGRLQDRIAALVWLLRELEGRGAERFHLVGHSTGGVDAQLLMTEAPFWGGDWSDNVRAVQDCIRSVTTISAPHYGTCLLDSPAGKFVAHPRQNLEGMLPFLKASGSLLGLIGRDASTVGEVLDLRAAQFPDAARFGFSVLRHHELLDELNPMSMGRIRASVRADLRARLTCYVSGADVRRDGRPSDPFYTELNAFGQTLTEPPSDAVLGSVTRIDQAPESLWIRNTSSPGFRIKVGTNDGIVNTARQLLPEATLGGILVADHGDVIGHYDRIDLATGRPMSTGLFRSGAGFGDDQFFALYERIAEGLGREDHVEHEELPPTAHAA